MSFKYAMVAATLTALASPTTMIGCGGDECVKAADHLEECVPLGSTTGGSDTTGSSTGLDTANACDGLHLCQSQCVNEAGCPTLQAIASNRDDPGLSDYNNCLEICNKMAN